MTQPAHFDKDEDFRRWREQLERARREEYRKLAFIAVLTGFSAWLLVFYNHIALPLVPLDKLTNGLLTVAILVPYLLFRVRAQRSALGIHGYLELEKTLLINEMPNIFQILSLLGFLTVFLSQQWVKITVTIMITFLLLIYLGAKRRELVQQVHGVGTKVTSDVTVPLGVLLGYIIGLVVYGLASLISVQLHG